MPRRRSTKAITKWIVRQAPARLYPAPSESLPHDDRLHEATRFVSSTPSQSVLVAHQKPPARHSRSHLEWELFRWRSHNSRNQLWPFRIQPPARAACRRAATGGCRFSISAPGCGLSCLRHELHGLCVPRLHRAVSETLFFALRSELPRSFHLSGCVLSPASLPVRPCHR